MSDLSTVNYGWIKPTVGSDSDTWGSLINGDLDGIDSTVHTIASIISIAGSEIINLSSSLTGVSSSLGNVSTSLGGVSSSLTGVSTSTAANTSSVSATAVEVANISTSLGGVSSSLAGVATAVGSATSGPAAANIGYLGVPGNPQSGAYTLLPTDAGKKIYSTNTSAQSITIAAHATQAIAVDSVIPIVNDGNSTMSITPAGNVTLILAGPGTTGSRALAKQGMATLMQVATDRWFISGPGVT